MLMFDAKVKDNDDNTWIFRVVKEINCESLHGRVRPSD